MNVHKSDFNQMRNGDPRMCPLCSRSTRLKQCLEDVPHMIILVDMVMVVMNWGCTLYVGHPWGQLQLQGEITPSSSSLICKDDLCKNDEGGHGGSDGEKMKLGWWW